MVVAFRRALLSIAVAVPVSIVTATAAPPAQSHYGWRARVASFDFTTGRVLSRAQDAWPGDVGLNNYPDAWSPDGQSLAFVRSDADGRRTVAIRSITSGSSRELPVAGLGSFDRLLWSPDGRRFLTTARDVSGCCRLVTVDAMSADVVQLAANVEYLRGWSADGARVYFDRHLAGVFGESAIVELDLGTRMEREIVRFPGGWSGRLGVAMAPDAKAIVFRSIDRPWTDAQQLTLKQVASGAERVLWSGTRLSAISYSTDGHHIITTIDGEARLIDPDTGALRPMPRVQGQLPAILVWAPDGKSFIGHVTVPDAAGKPVVTEWWVPLDGRSPRQIDLGLGQATAQAMVHGNSLVWTERIAQ